MSDPEARTRAMRWAARPLLGLLVVLTFLGHDFLMAAPASVVAADQPARMLTMDTSESHASAPHPPGCQVGQTMVLKTSDAPLPPPTATAFVGHPAVTQPLGLLSHAAVTRTRSPTAQRAVLQIFRM